MKPPVSIPRGSAYSNKEQHAKVNHTSVTVIEVDEKVVEYQTPLVGETYEP